MDDRNNNGAAADNFEYTVVLDENYTGPELNADGEGLNELLTYLPDKKADNEIRNQPVGVGKIPPLKQDKRIVLLSCFI